MLPQLDIATYPGQIFWWVIAFGLFYVLNARIVLPRIAEALDRRQARIESDLVLAEQAKREADALIDDYQQALLNARQKSQQDLQDLQSQLAAKMARQQHKFNAEMAAKMHAAEAHIASIRGEVLADLPDLAGGLTTDMARQLIRKDVPQSAVDESVKKYHDQLLLHPPTGVAS